MSSVRTPSRLALILAPALLLLAMPREGSATFLSISVASPTLAPGQSTEIGVVLTSTQNFTLQSATFVFTIDPARFTLTANSPGSLINDGFGTFVRAADYGAATVTLNGAGNPITNGQVGTIATFTLRALDNAPAGAGVIDLKASFATTLGANTATQINGGAIALSPAPTNGFDAGLDAVVTVAATGAVPEPSSLALCGLAGLAGLGYARSRGRRAISA